MTYHLTVTPQSLSSICIIRQVLLLVDVVWLCCSWTIDV